MAWSSEDEEAAEEGEGEGEEEERSVKFRGGKDDDSPHLTQYEKERMKTIERNRDALEKLQVKALATSLELSSQPQSRRHVKVDMPEGVRRRSDRLSSVKPNSLTPNGTVAADWSSSSNSDGEAADDSDGPSFSKSLLQQQQKKKMKVSVNELEDFETKKEDEEYEPSGNSDSEDSLEPEEEHSSDVPQSRKRKAPAKRTVSLSQYVSMDSPSSSHLAHPVEYEDEAALQQALALSLGSSMDRSIPRSSEHYKGEQSSKTQRKQTQKKANKNYQDSYFDRSEIDAFFLSIVGSLEGKLSIRLLESAASDQNFSWTEEELEDMILMFDNDEDGQLSLAEFRSMAERCKLMDGF